MSKVLDIIHAYGPKRVVQPTVETLETYIEIVEKYVLQAKFHHRPFSMDGYHTLCGNAAGKLGGVSSWALWTAMVKAGVVTAVEWSSKARTGGPTADRLGMATKLVAELRELIEQHKQGEKDEDRYKETEADGLCASTSHPDTGVSGGSGHAARSGELGWKVVTCDLLGTHGGEVGRRGAETDDDPPGELLRRHGGAHPMNAVKQLKSEWRDVIHGDGGNCPVCERWGKVYTRNLNKTMAQSLVWLYYAQTDSGDARNWIDVPNTAPKHVLRTNQLATLRWWGLIERKPEDTEDPTQKHTGLWRMTLKGMDFVEGKVSVPKSVETYNAEVVGYSKETIKITDVTAGFDYAAILGTAASSKPDALTSAVQVV